VPLEVLPRLIIAVLDGLAMQSVVDEEGAITREDVMRALESMASSLLEVGPVTSPLSRAEEAPAPR
jgi:hypothetical protein